MQQLTPQQQAHINKVIKTHKYFFQTYKFLEAGKENREFMAMQAFREKRTWPFSYSLDSVVVFLNHKSSLDFKLLEFLRTKPSMEKLVDYVAANLN